MTLYDKIEQISDFIDELNVFTQWGIFCHRMTDKDLPYGIGVYPGCNGTQFGYNDKEQTGYIWLSTLDNSTIARGLVNVVLGVDMLTSSRLTGKPINVFDIPLYMFEQLNKEFGRKYQISFSAQNIQKYIDKEYSVIYINFTHAGECTLPTYPEPIC